MPPTPTVRQNGHALRTFREMRGYSVAGLAELAQVSAPALRNWELENKALPIVKAERLCAALSIGIAAIDRDNASADRDNAPVGVVQDVA